jgi:hypothetical protein
MKVFVSHAVADRDIVLPFTKLVRATLGVEDGDRDVFCSSLAGSIENGKDFVKEILRRLSSADITIAILSQRYFLSNFCLAELGAAIVKQLDGSAKFFSLIIPPTDFGDLGGVLAGLQSGMINEDAPIDELLRLLAPVGDLPTDLSVSRAKFLEQIAPIVDRLAASELLKNLVVKDVYHEPDQHANYKSKLRVLLQNNTGVEVLVSRYEWTPGPSGVSMQNPRPGTDVFQVEGPAGWGNNDWRPTPNGAASMRVPIGNVCRLWIGLNQTYQQDQIRRFHEGRQLGTLGLQVELKGHTLPWLQQL